MPDTPDEAARSSRQRSAGFNAIKLGWGPLGRDGDLDVALVAAARKAGGDDFDLMIDVGFGWPSAREAIERARRMEEHRPFWIEEPFPPDEYAQIFRARRRRPTRRSPAARRRRRLPISSGWSTRAVSRSCSPT